MKKLFLPLLLAGAAICLSLQSSSHTPTPEPYESIDGIVKEVLKIISGEKGKERDWDAFRNLFTSNAQISVLVHGKDGSATTRSYTSDEFISLGKKYYENDGFLEYEIKKVVNEYNGIANVFQSYYAKELDVEEKGVNSYQLVHDGKRWWIQTLLWTSNRNGVELPEHLEK